MQRHWRTTTAQDPEQTLSNEHGGHAPETAQSRFGAGVEDLIIFPLVAIALAVKQLFHAMLSLLIHILDYAFPILLQLARFPLFTVRIIGDAIAALLKGVVRFLPMSGTKREAWRELVSEYWSWLRQKISYKAFEEAVHHAFERGMAWVFRKCRTLTPRAALLVIVGAALWLPISFGLATAMHAVLLAEAASLPAWMQLLHPLATVIAKTKLLVLPAYPAAWPQARKHPFVEAMFRFYHYVAGLYLMQKTGYRYRQTEHAAAAASDALRGAAASVGLSYLADRAWAGFTALAGWIGRAVGVATTRTVEGLARAPLIGAVVRSYAARYEDVGEQQPEKLSRKVSGFFARWSIHFSAEYYEAKEREEAAKRQAVAQAATDQPSAA
jgi:hypothetical protein